MDDMVDRTSPSIYLFSTMCSLIELYDQWMHRCMAQLVLLHLHDMQRIIKFFYLWKIPNILCIEEVVSMSGALILSLPKTPPMDTMGWDWPNLASKQDPYCSP